MRQFFKSRKIMVSLMAFSAICILLTFQYIKNKPVYIDFSMYEMLLKDNSVKKAKIEKNEIILVTQSGRYAIVKDGVDINQLLKHVPIEVYNENPFLKDLMLLMFLFLAIFALIYYGKRKKDAAIQLEANKKNQAFEMETMMPSRITPVVSSLSFKDVAGIDGVKEELTEIVDFLKNPQKYKKYGIRLPRGVLLVGPPGVGKTMVAKAVAGEANVPFFYQSGASFVQIYVGMGAKRVRELFSKAKAYAPSIVFIDEVDAVGKARGGMRNDEREATLNQLLTEIDGFEDSSGVIVIAATNKIEMIDEALLRSGRFDRRIFLSLPDFKDRLEILNVYLKDKPSNIDVEQIARMSVGFSSAALATFVNEAAINALRRNSQFVELEDFMSVRDKVLLGKRKVLSFNDEEKRIQATYQAAKALCAYWFDIDFDKITIVNDRLKDIDREIESKTQMIGKIKVYLAGLAASKIKYNETFSNAQDDIERARSIAEMMVKRFGMGDTLIAHPEEMNKILDESLKEVRSFLEGMSRPLEKITDKLLEEESISKSDLKKVMDEIF